MVEIHLVGRYMFLNLKDDLVQDLRQSYECIAGIKEGNLTNKFLEVDFYYLKNFRNSKILKI